MTWEVWFENYISSWSDGFDLRIKLGHALLGSIWELQQFMIGLVWSDNYISSWSDNGAFRIMTGKWSDKVDLRIMLVHDLTHIADMSSISLYTHCTVNEVISPNLSWLLYIYNLQSYITLKIKLFVAIQLCAYRIDNK